MFQRMSMLFYCVFQCLFVCSFEITKVCMFTKSEGYDLLDFFASEYSDISLMSELCLVFFS